MAAAVVTGWKVQTSTRAIYPVFANEMGRRQKILIDPPPDWNRGFTVLFSVEPNR